MSFSCCSPHMVGIKFIVIIEMVGSLILIIKAATGIIEGKSLTADKDEVFLHNPNKRSDIIMGTLMIMYSTFAIIENIVRFLTAIVLWIGMKERNEEKCLTWILITYVLMIYNVFELLGKLCSKMGISEIAFVVFQILYNFYFIGIVNAYRDQLLDRSIRFNI